MEVGQIYRSKELKNIYLKIVEIKTDGNVRVGFNFKKLNPNTFNYHLSYIDTFYEHIPSEENNG